MISVIICSREKSIKDNLAKNIQDTIGCDYELVVINNSNNKYSIFKAYNLGIEKSKGNLLCFMHDDIIYHTQNWGGILENIFKENPEAGLIGVAGSKLKTKMPSPWWNTFPEYSITNIIQHFNSNKSVRTNSGFKGDTEVEVAAIDGVFMVLKNHNNIFFNTDAIGFHNYDFNLSMEICIKGLKVLVTNRIEIEHFSRGSMNKDWYLSTILFHDLYKKRLPMAIGTTINEKAFLTLEFINGSKFTNQLMDHDLKKEALQCWFKLLQLKPYSKFHLKFLKRYFFE